jgi:hypothetical protein
MEPVRAALKPLLELLPEEVRNLAPPEVWGLLLLTVALVVLLILALMLRRLGRTLFGRKPVPTDWDESLRENLDDTPVPVRTPTSSQVVVYHLPARLRLVVVAPLGKDSRLPREGIPHLLELAVPGMGDMLRQDEPRLKVWPGQLSAQGFAVVFHRATRKAEAEGDPSRWVLLAGKVLVGKQPLLLGLGLWTDKPSTLGRITLEPRQWIDVLRFRPAGSA